MNDSQVMDPESGVDRKAQAVQEADEMRTAVASHANQFGEAVERQTSSTADAAEQLREAAETGWEEAKVKMQDLLQEGEAYVREHPGKSVATALGVGFVLGLLFRR